MYVQFNVLLGCRAFEEKDQREHAENDAADHAELIQVGEQHRLALDGFVEACHGKVAMVCNIPWRSPRARCTAAQGCLKR